MQRVLTITGLKYGAIAGLAAAQIYILGYAAVFYLGFGYGYGLSALFQIAGPILVIGQVVGALPATVLGSLLGGLAGFLYTRFPAGPRKIGALWGAVYALGLYLLLAGGRRLIFGSYLSGIDLFHLIPQYLETTDSFDRRLQQEFLLQYLPVFILYLIASTWAGAKFHRLAQERT